MNEDELTTVMERAASRLRPDVEALVAGGGRRGRRRRARARAVVLTAGLVAAVALGWAVRPGDDPVRAIDAGTPTAVQRPLADDAQVTRRLLALLADQDSTGLRIQSLDMGERTDLLDGLELRLRIHDAVVSVDVGDFSQDGQPWSPGSVCDSEGCRELPDGSWIWPRSGAGGDGAADDHGFLANVATVYTVDGWMVQVQASNSSNPGAGRPHVVTDAPVLTPEEVEALATSDLWFR